MSQRYIGGLIYNPPGGFSGYFDGSGDYLSVPDSTAFTMGTGDFSIELWYQTPSSARQLLVAQTNAAGSTIAFWVEKNASNQLRIVVDVGGSQYVATATATMPLSTWTFLQVVRSGTTVYGYQDGVQVCSVSVGSGSLRDSSDAVTIGGDTVGLPVTGYISNVRIIKGTAVSATVPSGPLQAVTNTQLLTCAYSTFRDGSTNNFTITVNGNTAVSTQNPFPLTTLPNPALGNQGNGVYSMSQYQALKQQNLWPSIDPYWRYVTLMLHGNGTNGAQNNTFLDSSTNNFTITRNGNTTQGTFAPFGNNWSNYFDGTGDYITSSQSQTIPATGDFTIDGWFWCNTYTNYPSILSQGTSGNAGRFNIYINNDGKFGVQIGATSSNIGSAVPTNQWVHFAVTRSGSTVTVYINGASIGTATNGTSIQNTTPSIGSEWTGDPYRWIGYLSNIRVSNVVRTISLPSSPFVADANTVLLTCQSNRFIDTSTTAATLTPNGNVSIQRFSPFAPTAPYAAGTDGGSGYFDGTGDYLSLPTSAESALNLTGTFTLEFWFYRNATGNMWFFSKGGGVDGWNATNGIAYQAFIESGDIKFQFYSGGISVVSTTAPPINSWNHFAVGRNGTTLRAWLNGASIGSTTDTPTPPTTRDVIRIASNTVNGNVLNGYMAGLRAVNGTDVYGVANTSITVPTAPLTAITNTSLLTNFTNAGILDNAEMNNLETVGNAQISTAQSKFGGASMLFDGSGDYLTLHNVLTSNLGSGPFTVELWVYFNSASGTQFILSNYQSVTVGWGLGIASGNFAFWATGDAPDISTSVAAATGVWYHLAVSGQSGAIRLFLNGTQIGSTFTGTPALDSTATLRIGDGQGAASPLPFNGYIDDLRITKGYARYTTSFTPQRSQWQDQ